MAHISLTFTALYMLFNKIYTIKNKHFINNKNKYNK